MSEAANDWRTIWNGRQVDHRLKSTLGRLIAADGFDSSFGGFASADEWVRYIDRLVARLGIERGDSVFEVGCGAGAFLYPFFQRGHQVAGIDYAENLIAIARDAMPDAQFAVGEAIRMQQETRYDFVIAHSVFFYFPDHAYAAEVLRRMAEVAVKGMGILDVPDVAKKDAALRYRKATLGDAQYEQRYKGLDHLYYDRRWFGETLPAKGLEIAIEEQDLAGYGNSKYRFNVFIRKVGPG